MLTSDDAATNVEKPGRATPSGDLNAFLVELSVALHRYSMYPSDHPSIGPSIEGVVRRATCPVLTIKQPSKVKAEAS